MRQSDEESEKRRMGYSMVNDRNALEWLVLWCLAQDDPCISISRGKELLGFMDMQQMRDFMNKHADVYRQVKAAQDVRQ